MSTPLLVTGGSGYLGGALLRAAGGTNAATYLTARGVEAAEWARLDVRDAAAVTALVERVRPRAVIHTAYLQDGPGAWDTNVAGSANVAAAAARAGARLVHVSTDLVFDGVKVGAYTEADVPNPLGDYGRSKLAAEREVAAAHPGALVVRTSLMVGAPEPGRQEQAVLAAARGEAPDAIFFEDELRSPLLVADLALALLELAAREESGVLHVGGPEALSRLELARRITAMRGLPDTRLRAGHIGDTGLVRPANCVLDSSRANALLRTAIRPVDP